MSEIIAPMRLYAQRAHLTLCGSRELLSAGMTGVMRVAFFFSPEWDGLRKIAVFSNGTQTVDVPQEDWEGDACTVPAEVLSLPGKTLMAGVYGTNGEQLVLPTVWCVMGRVEPGTVPALCEAKPPQAPLWTRMQERLDRVEATAPLLVHVAGTPLAADHTLEEITGGAQAGRPVLLEHDGLCCTLTRLEVGVRAEFSSPVDSGSYRLYTVGNQSVQVDVVPIAVTALPLGGSAGPAPAVVLDGYSENAYDSVKLTTADIASSGTPALVVEGVDKPGDVIVRGVAAPESDTDAANKAYADEAGAAFVVTLTGSGNTADRTLAELHAAHTAGKPIRLVDPNGRHFRLDWLYSSMAIFTSASWFNSDECFGVFTYILTDSGVTMKFLDITGSYYTRAQIDAALGSYITNVAELVGGGA